MDFDFLTAILVMFAASSVGTLVIGLLSRWIDRKVTARVQWRVGPPWYQPMADVVKLLGKETILPERARGRGFLLAPLIGFAAACLAAAILWAAILFRPQPGFIGDIIVVIYLLTIPALMTILGGAASGSPHAAVGASREMKLILSYELPLILAILVAVVQAGYKFSLNDVLLHQANGGWVLGHISGILAAAVMLLCTQAKLTLVPFDLPEAETELMSGAFVEYSGPPLAMIHLTRAMMLAIMPIFMIVLFVGGLGEGVGGAIAFVGKYVVILVLIVLIRNTNPRVRIDHAVRFFWFLLTPIAILALVLATLGW